jgi:hypothetical protein
MDRYVRCHHGVDAECGHCWRMRTVAEVRRCRERKALMPKIPSPGRELWRNGLHRRRWIVLSLQFRADRRCFLTTLKRRPLVPPTVPF